MISSNLYDDLKKKTKYNQFFNCTILVQPAPQAG